MKIEARVTRKMSWMKRKAMKFRGMNPELGFY
jgi:hypothetical protein